MNKIITVALIDVKADPKNPRQEFDPVALSQLEDSIKTNGILTPLAVEETEDGKYLLVDGERRFRASKNLKLKEIPVTVLQAMSDVERLVKRFHFQEQHLNWTMYEKAVAVKLLKDQTGMSDDVVAATLGMDRNLVNRYIMVSELSRRTANALTSRKLPFEWAIVLGRISKSIPTEDVRQEVENALVEKIDTKIIIKASEIEKYRKSIKQKGNEIVKKIIANKKYTPTQALKDAGMENITIFNSLGSALNWINKYSPNLLSQKNPTVPAYFHKRAASAVKLVKELADLDYEQAE